MPQVETLAGPVDVDALGTTLMHEHVFVLSPELQDTYPGFNGWDADREVARAQEALRALKERGVDGRLARSDAAGGEKVKKRKGKKERMREKAAATADGEGEAEDGGDEDDVVLTRDKKRKREERVKDEEGETHDEGDKSKKKRRRHHKKSDVVAS